MVETWGWGELRREEMRPRHPCCLIQKARVLASSAWRMMEAINLGNDDDDSYEVINLGNKIMLITMMMINTEMDDETIRGRRVNQDLQMEDEKKRWRRGNQPCRLYGKGRHETELTDVDETGDQIFTLAKLLTRLLLTLGS